MMMLKNDVVKCRPYGPMMVLFCPFGRMTLG